MPQPTRYRDRIELLPATPDLLAPRAPRRAPRHGSAISRAPGSDPGAAPRRDTGPPRPAPRRPQGRVRGGSGREVSGRRVKASRLTAAGERPPASERRWRLAPAPARAVAARREGGGA